MLASKPDGHSPASVFYSDCGNRLLFTGSAAITPALSQHVMLMEAALGVSLLHRTTRGVLATEAGLRLFERALAIDAEFSTLNDHVRGVAVVPGGEVRFGMPGTINEQLGVPLIEAARRQYPNIRIRISEAMSGFVLDWLRDGSVDLALLYNVPDKKGLTLHHSLTEEVEGTAES